MQPCRRQRPRLAEAPAAPAAAGPHVVVQAVEIDGRKIFVAGAADPGRVVRGYANEILLGDAKASPDGRYLIEAERDLPVGDYIIRVDALEPDGVKVAARAAVPFEREPGKSIAAVAPPPRQPCSRLRRRKRRRRKRRPGCPDAPGEARPRRPKRLQLTPPANAAQSARRRRRRAETPVTSPQVPATTEAPAR